MNPIKEIKMAEVEELYEVVKNDEDYQFMAVVVKTPSAPGLEVIVNPRKNFEGKMAYYMKVYDENGRLLANPEVRILGIAFTQEWSYIEGYVESLT